MPDPSPRLEIRRVGPFNNLCLCLPGGVVLPSQQHARMECNPDGPPIFVVAFMIDGASVVFDWQAQPARRVPNDLAAAARAFAALSPANRSRFRTMHADMLKGPAHG